MLQLTINIEKLGRSTEGMPTRLNVGANVTTREQAHAVLDNLLDLMPGSDAAYPGLES